MIINKTFISLFGGIGGFDLALTRKKWRCVGYYDNDKYAVQTYNKNFGTRYEPTDITKVPAEEVPEHYLLTAGFPCQSFSVAGQRKGFQDTRGTLFFDICRIVKAKRPPLLLLENVKGLLNHDEGRTFGTILAALDELGYDVQWQVLNSKHYGVPQNRERVFIIGHIRGQPRPEVFPIGTPEEVSVEEQGQGEIILFQNSGKEMARVYDTRGISPTLKGKTGGWQEPIIMNTLTEALGTRQGSSKEFQNSIRKIIECSKQARRLTPLEFERLQSFPDNWTEGVSDTQRYKQLGNAVTVNVIEAIIEKLEEY